MGKIAGRMAPLAARGPGDGQGRGTREEALAIKASRGAKIRGTRREAVIQRMPEVRIPAFAKINLRLDILGKREDGFHELRTIFQTISLHDDLRLRASRGPGITRAIDGHQMLSAEPVEKNLVYRAVDALRRELRIQGRAEIELRKKNPPAPGLSRRSSDAAT